MMPYFIVEFTANLEPEGDLPGLLKKVNDTLIAQGGVFPIGGIRSRAIRLDHYRMADGEADYAFVYARLQIGARRDEATKQRVGDQLFDVMKATSRRSTRSATWPFRWSSPSSRAGRMEAQ